MANTIDVTQAQYFIPELWSQRALEILRAKTVLAGIVSQDTSADGFRVGDILHIPYPGTFSANDKAAGTAVTMQQPANGTEVQVTLNKHKEVTFVIEDIAQAQASQELMSRYVTSAVVALADQIEKDIIIEAYNLTPTAGTAGTDMSAATMRAVRKVMNDNAISEENRHIMLSTKDELALIGDSNLATYWGFQQNAIQSGQLNPLYGITPHFSQKTPIGALVTLGTQASGTFTLTFAGQTTSALQYNASAATVKTALEALSTVGSGKVDCTGSAGGPYTIIMKDTLGANTTSWSGTFSSLATPGNASIKDAVTNIALVPDAFMLAMRGLITPNVPGVAASTIRDPQSGLVLRTSMAYSPTYLGVQVTLDVLYGVKTLRAVKGVKVYA